MGEFQEFAEALFGQLSVELDEEKEITELATRAKEILPDNIQFKELEDIANGILSEYKQKAEEFLGVKTPDNIDIKFPELSELKESEMWRTGAAVRQLRPENN